MAAERSVEGRFRRCFSVSRTSVLRIRQRVFQAKATENRYGHEKLVLVVSVANGLDFRLERSRAAIIEGSAGREAEEVNKLATGANDAFAFLRNWELREKLAALPVGMRVFAGRTKGFAHIFEGRTQ